jgi:predicted ABC-class ATPase
MTTAPLVAARTTTLSRATTRHTRLSSQIAVASGADAYLERCLDACQIRKFRPGTLSYRDTAAARAAVWLATSPAADRFLGKSVWAPKLAADIAGLPGQPGDAIR